MQHTCTHAHTHAHTAPMCPHNHTVHTCTQCTQTHAPISAWMSTHANIHAHMHRHTYSPGSLQNGWRTTFAEVFLGGVQLREVAPSSPAPVMAALLFCSRLDPAWLVGVWVGGGRGSPSVRPPLGVPGQGWGCECSGLTHYIFLGREGAGFVPASHRIEPDTVS